MEKINKAGQKGFTLIEIIMVVIIIGILAGIGLPQYGKTVEKSRVTEATNILGTIRQAQFRYAAEYGDYAPDLNNLTTYTHIDIPSSSKFFNFFADPSGDPDDNINDIVAEAQRNGQQVGGGYPSDYRIYIMEEGNFTSSLGGPPL